jgi:rare lipoprotein A
MGTRVKVVNLDNGRSAVLKIVDRGPFIRGRVIDVSPAAASALGFRQAGLAHVRIERN